jgi:3D (Asp-Asp-Asp) domain-containing protein
LAVLATSYCDRGHTADGTAVSTGVIAVDPRVIRLGTRLRIVFAYRSLPPGARNVAQQFARPAAAHDTGGSIHGARIDIWTPVCADAIAWGVRVVHIQPLRSARGSPLV